MQAKILKFKVNHSAKKALFIRNGTPRDAIAIELNKAFKLEDAMRILGKIGRF